MTLPRGHSRSVNAEILDRIIHHSVYLEQYKSYEIRSIVSFLNQQIEPEIIRQLQKYAGRELTVKRLRDLRQAVREIVLAGYLDVSGQMTADLRQLGVTESKWNRAMLQDVTPVKFSFASPSVASLRDMIRNAPIHGRLVNEWLADLAPATISRVNQQLMVGATMGEGIDQIVRRIAGTRANQYADGILQRSRRDIEGVVRTSIAGVSNNARQLTYEANTDIVKGVALVATLDLRTCPICGDLDGHQYDIDAGPRPPIHPSCRCTTCPVLKSWRELGFTLRELPESTRASLDGQVPAMTDFVTWLSGRSAVDQDEVLGPTRGRMYRAGAIEFRAFVDAENHSRMLTLEELEQRP